MPQRQLVIERKDWPVAGVFRISRDALSQIPTLIVSITENGVTGRGECRPYARYDETPDSVTGQIECVRRAIEGGIDAAGLQPLMPAGAARNAVDCALWDLACKSAGRPFHELAGLPAPSPRTTAFTISVDEPEMMSKAAKAAAAYPVLKVKITAARATEMCEAVAAARPDAALIIDANEALDHDGLAELRRGVSGLNAVMIEQPLPADIALSIPLGADDGPPLCADESLHGVQNLEKIWTAGYRIVNVKLDKTGGVTGAIDLARRAKEQGFRVMAGCMVASSLAMAPMMMLESFCDFIDLDGPLLLDDDVPHGLKYSGPIVHPPSRQLWG